MKGALLFGFRGLDFLIIHKCIFKIGETVKKYLLINDMLVSAYSSEVNNKEVNEDEYSIRSKK